MDTATCIIISFGLAGHSEERVYPKGSLVSKSSLSGYQQPETWGASNDCNYPDGTPVIDKREVLEERPSLALKSPMVGASDKPFELPAGDPLMSGLIADFCAESPAVAGSVVAHMESQDSDEPGALDTISPERYVKWWAERGARIGRIENNQIVFAA